MGTTLAIDTSDAKYGIRIPPSGEAYATRNGLMWRLLEDAPHVLSLARDLSEARTELSGAGEDPLAHGTPPARYGSEGHLLDLSLSDGSRVVQTASGASFIETAGGDRIDTAGDNLVLGLAYDLEGARARLAEIRAAQDDPAPSF